MLSALDESESAESGNHFNNAKLRDRFLKPKIKENRKKLYEKENKKNFCKSKRKEIEQNLIELEVQ